MRLFPAHARREAPGNALNRSGILRRWTGQDTAAVQHQVMLDPPGKLKAGSFTAATRLVAAGQGIFYLIPNMAADMVQST